MPVHFPFTFRIAKEFACNMVAKFLISNICYYFILIKKQIFEGDFLLPILFIIIVFEIKMSHESYMFFKL